MQVEIRYNATDAKRVFKTLAEELERIANNLDKSKKLIKMIAAIVDASPTADRLRVPFHDCELLADAAGDERTLAKLRFFQSEETDCKLMIEGLEKSLKSGSIPRHVANLRAVAQWTRGFVATIGKDGIKRETRSKFKWISKKEYLAATKMSPSTFDRKKRSGLIKTDKRPNDPKQKPCRVKVPANFGEE